MKTQSLEAENSVKQCNLTDNLDQLITKPDPAFKAFVASMPDKHWSKYDISAVRLGWEAYKLLIARHKDDK